MILGGLIIMIMSAFSVSASDEWTFEMARKCWEPLVRPIANVGVPGNQWQTSVTWDGSLVFGPLVPSFRTGHLRDEIAPLGDNLMHVSIGFGEKMRFADR